MKDSQHQSTFSNKVVDMNPLVFNTVCQMFQLVCILLQAIACCINAVVSSLLRVQREVGIWETLFLFLFDYIFFKLLFLSVKLYNSIDDTFMYAHLHTLGH